MITENTRRYHIRVDKTSVYKCTTYNVFYPCQGQGVLYWKFYLINFNHILILKKPLNHCKLSETNTYNDRFDVPQQRTFHYITKAVIR